MGDVNIKFSGCVKPLSDMEIKQCPLCILDGHQNGYCVFCHGTGFVMEVQNK